MRWVQVVVRAETGPDYRCHPERAGAWRCGRCDIGLFPPAPGRRWPARGARCLVCRAEVVEIRRLLRRLVRWLVVLLLAALAAWWLTA
jgi:hypothetical protein